MQDDPSAEYLIRKGGYYYRPNAKGYTTNIAEAGRYSLAQAISYSHPNGPDGPRDGISYEPAPAMQDDLAAAGEYICLKCGRRQNSDHSEPSF